MRHDITQGMLITTYGLGPFYPAISIGSRLWYWHELPHETEDEAYLCAAAFAKEAEDEANHVVSGWNVTARSTVL